MGAKRGRKRVVLFGGRLRRLAYLTRAAIRVALFAATVVGFPYILFAIGKLTNCASPGGACGAVALVASTALKPIFFIAFVLSLVGISMRRTRDAGLPAAVGLIIPGLVTADYQFGLFGGAH